MEGTDMTLVFRQERSMPTTSLSFRNHDRVLWDLQLTERSRHTAHGTSK